MIKIAVIDDGISTKKIKALDFNLEINNNCIIIPNNNMVEDNSHGTTCAMIIKKYAPDALLGSIKILQTYTKRGYVNQFRKALEWCIQNNISLINISLGSTQSYDHSILYDCVEDAYHNGVIIVAAFSNKHVVTYPASFQNVIGVVTDPLLKDDMYYMKQNSIEGINVASSSVHIIGNEITPMCNSYAAPLIAAKVYNIINQYGYRDIEHIKIILNSNSHKKIENYDPTFKSRFLITDIKNKLIKQIEIPCIMIEYKSTNDIIPYFVNNMFNQNGYSTLLILTDKYQATEDPSIVITEKLDDNTLAYIASKYEVDIIVIGLVETNNTISNITCDILFYHESGDNSLITNQQNDFISNRNISCEFMIGYKSGNNLIEYIYQKTKELLS